MDLSMLRILALIAVLPALASAQSPLATTFANPAPGFVVSNTPTPITGLMDVTVTEPMGIELTQIDLQVNTTHGVNGQVAVYITAPGSTHVGNELNAGAWTLMSTATMVHSGGRVSFVLQTPVPLGPATYGLAFHCIEANPIYHGGAVSVGLPQSYSNAELTIDLSLARMRASIAANPFGGGGLGFSPRQLAVGLFYTIGTTLVDFSATPRSGPSPLAVQFTSVAASNAPGGILAYVWDFDNDGIPDASVPNPLFTFTSCGNYTVSLQIIDVNGGLTASKVDYVITDIVTPDFENTIVGSNTVLFTDLSTPTPTQWAWDFDSDGLTDSVVQNPVFVFPNGCDETTVTLTTTLACQSPTTVTRTIAVATSIETTFQGGFFTAAGALSSANYFDIDVTNPLGITVCGLHVNSQLAVGTPLIVNLYQTEGTYVGATGDASLWRSVASETVMSAGPGVRTFVSLSTSLHLAAGTFGICMEHVGDSPIYSNLGGPLVVSNADVTITAGVAQGEPVFDPAAAVFGPRIVNIALHYATSQSTGAAGYGYIGSGCAGTLGVPTNVASSQPILGGTAQFAVDNLPLGIGIMALGTVRSAPPLDLAIVGMPGCPLHHDAGVLQTMLGAGTSATFDFPIPNNPVFIGTQIFTQAASLDIGLNTLGFALSDAAVMLVGQ